MKHDPKITVHLINPQTELTGRLDGNFHDDGFGPVPGRFSAKAESGMIVFSDEANSEICRPPWIRLIPTFLAGQTRATPLLPACL